MSETFQMCKNNIGKYFIISPGFINQPALKLIKHTESCLTFFDKTGSREIRYDLKEEDFKYYKISHA